MRKNKIKPNNPENLEDNKPKHRHHLIKKITNRLTKAQKIIIVSAAIAVVACAAAFGIFRFVQNIDYMRPVRDICSIYNNRETDTNKIVKLIYTGSDKKTYNLAYKIITNSDTYYTYFENLPSQLEDYYRDNAAAGGNAIKMKFDITGSKDKMDESQLAIIYNELEGQSSYYQEIIDAIDNLGKEDYQTLADSMGISYKRATTLCEIIRSRCESRMTFKISSGYYVTGRYVLYNKDNDTVEKTDKLTLAIIKLNGKWCIYEGREDGVRLATGMDSMADNDILWDIYTNYIKTIR